MELLPLVCFCLLICSGTTFGDEGSSPEPYVTILNDTNDWALLQCKVQDAFPKPKVQWLDSENKTVPAEEPQETESEGKYNIILKANVTKSDVYRCVSTQEAKRPTDLRINITLPVIKMRVKEDEDVILPCSLDSTNIRSETFDWKKDNQKNVFQYNAGTHYNNGRGGQDPQFKGRVFHFEDQLQSGNASIKIRKTNKTDSGYYRCIFPFKQPKIRSIIKLIVDCILKDRTEEKIAGSCLKPYVTILLETKDWALLQCEVQGAFSKPKLQWLDSENKTVPAEEPQETESEGKYNIILKATVTKSDVYRCVSTQEEICHQIYSETHVNLNGAASRPSVSVLDQTKDWALLQCEVQGVSPKPKVVWKDSAGNIVPAKEPEVTENGGSYNIILKATVTKTDNYRCVSTQEEINHEVHAETYVHLNDKDPGSSTGWIVGLVVGVGLTSFVWWCKKQYSNRDGTVYRLINRCLPCLRRQNAELEAGQQNGAQESMMPTADARAEHEAERLNLKRPEQPDQKVINKAELMSL